MRVNVSLAHGTPLLAHPVNESFSSKRSALPVHPALTLTYPMKLAALLDQLRRNPEVREALIKASIHKQQSGLYFTRQTAELTAQTIFDSPAAWSATAP